MAAAAPGRVRTGLEVLLESGAALLKKKQYGLICNAASVDGSLRHAAELLLHAGEGRLAGLFGPEHGVTAEAQDMAPVEGATDARTGLPVHSLYGAGEDSLAPPSGSLRGLDLLLFDLQDVGARYYTFTATMAAAMEACARDGVGFVVLDRPNPLGGLEAEGNIVREPFRSFVGRAPLPVRHGMTCGELARFFNEVLEIHCSLTVVPMEGWTRGLWFDGTGLPWVPPSPNMPTLDTATVYPGTCLIEGTNLSEGRGTTRPFEWVGAPYLDPHELSEGLNGRALPGVTFRPLRFTPSFHKWAGKSCGGVQVHVSDRSTFKPFLTGLAILSEARRLAPARFEWRRGAYEFVSDRLAIDLLLGDEGVRHALERGERVEAIQEGWQAELSSFQSRSERFRLY